MHHLTLIPLFLSNIRGWQLIIIVILFLVFFVLVPGAFGFVLGRRPPKSRRKK